jgi:hypothetical protein
VSVQVPLRWRVAWFRLPVFLISAGKLLDRAMAKAVARAWRVPVRKSKRGVRQNSRGHHASYWIRFSMENTRRFFWTDIWSRLILGCTLASAAEFLRGSGCRCLADAGPVAVAKPRPAALNHCPELLEFRFGERRQVLVLGPAPLPLSGEGSDFSDTLCASHAAVTPSGLRRKQSVSGRHVRTRRETDRFGLNVGPELQTGKTVRFAANWL